MRRFLYKCLLSCLLIVGCISANNSNATMTATTASTPSAIMTGSILLLHTSSPTPIQLVFPLVTMSSQENENALIELFKTNGNCMGKCIGGIYPDKMTVQDAVNVMAKWGMVTIGQNSQGKTFINLAQNQLYGQLNVYLSVGTWTKELETIDKVAIRIEGLQDRFLGEDVWLANREAFRGFRMDNLLKTYGVPSYVGFSFPDRLSPSILSDKSNRFSYGMRIRFEALNLEIFVAAKANYDGGTVTLCPSKDPHYIWIEINPENSLKKTEKFYPVTWQALTSADLNAFYQTFTGENAFDACIKTALKQILTLQP